MNGTRPVPPPGPGLRGDALLDYAAGQWGWLARPGEVREARVLGVPNGDYPARAFCGYFAGGRLRDLAAALAGLKGKPAGTYVTLNPARPDLVARADHRLVAAKAGGATKDAEVAARRWLLIDVDPVRPKGVSATDAEKAEASAVIDAARAHLAGLGWPAGLLADSGNGYHAFYRVELPADDGRLVERVLKALAARFDTPAATVDRAVANASRVVKLPMTWARKGDSTPERPHRRATLLEVPDVETPDGVGVVSREQLEALADECPPPTSSTKTVVVVGVPADSSTATAGEFTSRLDVGRWLADRGVGFRVKGLPDGLGRTAYVLAACPFNPEHADPDACVMQAADGRLSAKCLHSSCAGNGWQAFKRALGAPGRGHYAPPLGPTPPRKSRPAPAPAGGPQADGCDDRHDNDGAHRGGDPVGGPPDGPGDHGDPQGGGLPAIVVNDRQLPAVTADALAALAAANDPPTLFRHGDHLARLRRPGGRPPRLEPLTEPAARGELARAAAWVATRGDAPPLNVSPPPEVVRDLLALPDWPDLPRLEGVVECPVFDAAGTLVAAPGFHPASSLWYAPAEGLVVPAVPGEPTDAEVAAARELILTEWLGDFPFADRASRATAVAILLLPLVRPMIDGPTPLHLIDAPTEGTGKTLLASVLGAATLGRAPHPVAEGQCDEEWRKRITAMLVEGTGFVLIDNLARAVDSAALASVLTTADWSDRILGVTKMARVPNRAVWVATGNNPSLSGELLRRTVRCRLDRGRERPAEATGFRHPRLLAWTRGHRGELLAAALTLVRAWLARGRPPGTAVMGMYESWAEVVGGVLDAAGVPGLLANRAAFQASQGEAQDEWPAFLAAWGRAYGDRPVDVGALHQLAVRERHLDAVLGDAGERSERTRLGMAVAKQLSRVTGGVRVVAAGANDKGRPTYRLLTDGPTRVEDVADTIGR